MYSVTQLCKVSKMYCISFWIECVLHVRDCHMYTRWAHVRELGVDCKSQEAEDEQKSLWLSKEVVLEKSVSWNSSDFSLYPVGTSA